jgi:hypothetical protein
LANAALHKAAEPIALSPAIIPQLPAGPIGQNRPGYLEISDFACAIFHGVDARSWIPDARHSLYAARCSFPFSVFSTALKPASPPDSFST